MKRFLMIVCLAGTMAGSSAVAAGPLPWFHTRPKPVFLDQQPSSVPSVAQNRVPYHGTAVYPESGRLYFEDARDRLMPQTQQSGFHLTDWFTRAWRSGAQAAQSKATASKPATSK